MSQTYEQYLHCFDLIEVGDTVYYGAVYTPTVVLHPILGGIMTKDGIITRDTDGFIKRVWKKRAYPK